MKLKQAFTIIAVVLLAVAGAASVRAAPLSENDRRIYSDAFATAKHGDWPRALRLAATARDPLPANVLRWLQAKQQGSGISFAEITAFIDAHRDWPMQKLLYQRAEEVIATATDAQLAPWFSAHPQTL